MPVSVRYLNDPDQECVIRPAPLVSVNTESQRNAQGKFGTTYRVTLRGYIIVDLGFPLARDTRTDELFPYFDGPATGNAGPYNSFDTGQSHSFETGVEDNRPARQNIPYEAAVDAMLYKQRALRSLFETDGQRLEISPIHTDEPALICYPRLSNITFTDGIYTDVCEYTIELECDTILDNNLNIDLDGVTEGGHFIQNYTDNWSLEVDEGIGESEQVPRSYRITRQISATGKDHYLPTSLEAGGTLGEDKKAAWEQARDFVQSKLKDQPDYPNVAGRIGSGVVDLVDAYQGFNHTRVENIGVAEGTYGVTENWLLASGTSYENYTMSVETSIDDPFVQVSINGEITGLSTLSTSAATYGGEGEGEDEIIPYQNAIAKYYEVSNSGAFGIGSVVYNRADSAVGPTLNAQPKSIALGVNEQEGNISYSLAFDNRPTNILSGVLTEDIAITDTLPGDVFNKFPIPGRSTGPVFQPDGSRTEYTRDLSLSVLLDYTKIPYGSGRQSFLLQKPSLVEPLKSQIMDLVDQASPANTVGIRRWFLNAPVENWQPKTGQYSLNVSWEYELDR